MTRSRWVGVVLLVVVVVVGATGRAPVSRKEILGAPGDGLSVAGWTEPWTMAPIDYSNVRWWRPANDDSGFRHGVTIQVDSWVHRWLAEWDISRHDLAWFDFENLVEDGDVGRVYPDPVVLSGLDVADERLLCVSGHARSRCELWLWEARYGHHVITIYYTDRSGVEPAAAVDVVRSLLVAIPDGG